MKKNRYILILILVFVVIAVGVLLRTVMNKGEDVVNQDTTISFTVKNNVQDSKKNWTIKQNTDSINSNMHSSVKFYSLVHDREIEKELIREQHDKLLKTINLQNVAQRLSSNYEQERLSAIKTLSYFPENKFIQLIEKMLLSDPSSDVKSQCAVTLQLLESNSSISTLIKALNDQDRNVKLFATLALAALGEKEKCFAVADSMWNNGRSDAPFFSCHMAFRDIDTPDAADRLIYDLNNNDRFVAIDAAIILAQLGHSKEAFPLLEQSLSHDDKYIRMAALRGLAYIGDQKSLELIKSKINDQNNLVRERAHSIIKNFNNNDQ